MTNEYSSKLISNLYAASDEHEAYEVVSEMGELLGEIYLYPIYDAYKKFKGGVWSHAFISAIARIDSPDSLEILKAVADDANIHNGDYVECLGAFEKVSYFEEPFLTRAEAILVDSYVQNKINYFLPELLRYLEKAGRLASHAQLLKALFENTKLEKDARRQALAAYLKLSPKKNISDFSENYAAIRNSDSEIILTKELLTWKGPAVEQFIAKVKSDGSPSARHLVQQKEEDKDRDREREVKRSVDEFSNGKEVAEIGAARKKINELSKSTSGIETDIFPEDETIITQVSTVKTRDELVSKCSSLRELVQNISKGAREHGFDLEKAQEYLSTVNADSLNKSLTSLHLFLLRKGVKVPSNLFGLREIVTLSSLLAAHQEDPELLPTLKKHGLIDDYHSDKWGELHKRLLNMYVAALNKLITSLEEFRKGQV